MAVEPIALSADVPTNSYVGQWMTHDELASVRGIDRTSAVRLALRHGWQRQRDKHRVLRVLVPAEWLHQSGLHGAGNRADEEGQQAAGTASFEAAEQARRATETWARQADQTRAVERSMWQERVASERERADKAEQEQARLLAVIDALEARLAAAEVRADAADEDRRMAEARADAAVSRALAADGDRRIAKAHGDAERARAEVLDQAIADERARAAALKAKVDELKGLLANLVRAQGARRR